MRRACVCAVCDGVEFDAMKGSGRWRTKGKRCDVEQARRRARNYRVGSRMSSALRVEQTVDEEMVPLYYVQAQAVGRLVGPEYGILA